MGRVEKSPLSEVEQAIYGYNLEDMADEYADEHYEEFGMYKTIYEAYSAGFNVHKELAKEKMFTVGDMERELVSIAAEIASKDGELSSCSPALICSWIKNKIQSLLPRTQWDIEIDEAGKITIL